MAGLVAVEAVALALNLGAGAVARKVALVAAVEALLVSRVGGAADGVRVRWLGAVAGYVALLVAVVALLVGVVTRGTRRAGRTLGATLATAAAAAATSADGVGVHRLRAVAGKVALLVAVVALLVGRVHGGARLARGAFFALTGLTALAGLTVAAATATTTAAAFAGSAATSADGVGVHRLRAVAGEVADGATVVALLVGRVHGGARLARGAIFALTGLTALAGLTVAAATATPVRVVARRGAVAVEAV